MPEDSNPSEQLDQAQSGSETAPAEQTRISREQDSGERAAAVTGAGALPEDAPELEPSQLPFPVVAIGASAGGLEAYVELLEALPKKTGMSFVFVPHIAAEQKSHLVEILSRHTSMPVAQVQTGEAPQPNHVHVIPPNTRLSIVHGLFKLEPRPAEERIPRPIDHFFRTVAADQKNRALGVLLSGADSDGALGLRAIKGEGGITIVQQPTSARFGEMPRSGIAADHVDLVLPPNQIGVELGRLALQYRKPEVVPLEDGGLLPHDADDFRRLMTLLRGISGIEFSFYRPATLRRRIARRMMLKRVESLSDYLHYVQRHREELQELQEDVLINVTRFFRDPEVWQTLASNIIPRLFEDRSPDRQVRVWVPGCSTGEEAYSIAICLLEYLAGHPFEPPIQIFGTDASERSVERARLGIYPESLAGEISTDRLRRFFVKTERGYQVSKRLRDVCIFARQNLCNDPPFSKLDLISCRNVLIYMGRELQKQIISTFHYALRPNGFLLLGNSEAIRGFNELFASIDRRYKIYSRIGSGSRLGIEFPARAVAPDLVHADTRPISENHLLALDVDLQRAADRIVLARYGPPGVIVNDRMEILQSRGHTAPFLEMAPGTPSLQLIRMLNDSIAVPVRDAVRRAIDLDLPARVEGLQVRSRDTVQYATVEVLPVHTIPASARSYLVLFAPESTPHPPVPHELPSPPAIDREREEIQLRTDLASTKLYLQSLLEDRDVKNQELISANEEIQSANEELQSTNEELETTKEELQSANEELQTVNEELQQRNANLTRTSNDLTNLLSSVNLPVLMLSSDLRVRHFTTPTQRLMSLRSGDIGRPLSDIRIHLKIGDLEPIFNEVVETLGTKEMEVQDRDGRWYLMRLRPYRTADNKIEGVVLVLVDIDQLRRSEKEVRQARDFARAVIESIHIPLVVLAPDLKVRSANDAFRNVSGLPSEELENRSFPELVGPLWGIENLRTRLEELAQSPQTPAHLEFEHQVSGQESRWLCFAVRKVVLDQEHVLSVAVEDITERKNVQQLLERERQRLTHEVQSAAEALGRTQSELRALTANLFTSQEEERRRVARELHDDVSQQLALLHIELEKCEQRFSDAPKGVSQNLQQLRQRTALLADDVRSISHRLHPSILDDLGLPQALKALVEEFGEREEMLANFIRRDVPLNLSKEVATTLYRITQEALRNISKHAGRTHAKVTLEGSDSRLRLEVADFGEGFDIQERRGGLGLISMEERARLVGGTFAVQSALGKGTTVTVEVPLPASQTGSEQSDGAGAAGGSPV
jgi:two-component system, chemotaxis family, CheB/CheR fusion protein